MGFSPESYTFMTMCRQQNKRNTNVATSPTISEEESRLLAITNRLFS